MKLLSAGTRELMRGALVAAGRNDFLSTESAIERCIKGAAVQQRTAPQSVADSTADKCLCADQPATQLKETQTLIRRL